MIQRHERLAACAGFLALVAVLCLQTACSSDAMGSRSPGSEDKNPPSNTVPTEPSFAIISPESGATVRGSQQIVLEIVDIDVSAVDIILDNDEEPVCTIVKSPYTCLVDLSVFDTGTMHTITAEGLNAGRVVATDAIDLVRTAFSNNICTSGTGSNMPLVNCLADLYNEGSAAGNIDDYYENRDSDHTMLNTSNHPQVTYLDGPHGVIDFGKTPQNFDPTLPLVGNASVCVNSTGSDWCEGVARYLIRTGKAGTLYNLYKDSNFYWFPEHTDHDAEDLAFYMVPFVNSSQGSSGSEMDEVEKWLYTLAAFTPETKTEMISSGTLMPTIQMIYRRTLVESDTEYLSDLAHANAYEDSSNTYEMVRVASNMAPDEIPPMAQLTVLEDTFDSLSGEAAFTTPVAIARRWRTAPDTPRRIVLSAQDSYDPNGRPLTFHWRLIRGNPEHVRITPQGENGETAEIEIDFHAPEILRIGGQDRLSTLVSVAVFAHNGVYFSAPAFITSSTLDYTP